MSDDMLEVCSNCGKMPRGIDLLNGTFRCSRCGNSSLTALSNDDYEKVVIELDRKYQAQLSQKRLETVEKINMGKPKSAKAKKADKKSVKKAIKKKKK